jgi:hypothetical protein
MSTLTPELRAEIEQILLAAKDDNRHAMAFNGLQRGLVTRELAAEWNKSQSYVSMIVRSLQLMLGGELPDRPSIALTNSFGYRGLLDYKPSAALRDHTTQCLRVLFERNPRVRLEPMGNVAFYDGATTRAPRRQPTFCGNCYLTLPCDCE